MAYTPIEQNLSAFLRLVRTAVADQDKANAMVELAGMWRELGEFRKTRACLEQANDLDPDSLYVKRSLGLELFRAGEVQRGLNMYDKARWNLDSHQVSRRPFSAPFWDGSPVQGKRILVWAEQGIGDQIMQIRIVPQLVAAGAHVTLESDPRLFDLLGDLRQQVTCVSQSAPPDPVLMRQSFDYQTSAFSAWRFMSLVPEQAPYLFADVSWVRRYRTAWDQDAPLLNVGLSWFSRSLESGVQRSVDPAWLNPLSLHKTVRFHSVQYAAEDLNRASKELCAKIAYDPDMDLMTDFVRPAAYLCALDLCITIDNSTAHLAAALGVPTWVLLPKASEWRWGLHAEKSAFYPSVTLIRATDYGHWGTALERLFARFDAFVAGRGGHGDE